MAVTIAAGARAIVTLLLFWPVGPSHVIVYVVVALSEGVVNEPDVPVMPLGEEEQEVLSVDDHVMTAVWAGELSATKSGFAAANRVVNTAGVFGVLIGAALGVAPLPPPHEAIPATIDSIANKTPGTNLCLTVVVFDMMGSLTRATLGESMMTGKETTVHGARRIETWHLIKNSRLNRTYP